MGSRLGLSVAVLGVALAVVAPAGPVLRAHAQDSPDKPMDLRVEDAEIADVVALIRPHATKPIVLEKDVHGKVTINLRQVPWRDTLSVIAKMVGFEVVETEKELVVRSNAPIDVDADNKPLADVVAEIGRKVSRTITVDKAISGDVTCHLKGVAWRSAVRAIARTVHADAELREQDGKLFVVRALQEAPKVAFREYPIGDEVEREAEHLKVAAVWLPPVTMDHECEHAAGPHVVHLECDIHATRGNENGFAVGDWIPYLTIAYRIEPSEKSDAAGKLEGKLLPMVAKDGPHYGATIAMPATGKFKLTYSIEPPSSNGLGRHTDPITGVGDWWKPFEATYAWDYKGIPTDGPGKGPR